MTYPGFSAFKVGGVQFPLTSDGYDLIVQADPAVYHILQFFKYCINNYLADKWLEQVIKINLQDAAGAVIGNPVEQLIPYSPADYLTEVQYRFPFLSADRIRETYIAKTREWYEVIYILEIVYALPPLTAEQMYQMNAFRVLVPRILQDRIEVGWDPGYRSGETILKTAGIEEIKMLDSRYFGLENPANVRTFFPTIIMNFEVKERRNVITEQFPPLTDIGGIIYSDGYDLIDFHVDIPS
jgi:hypothetical protein